MKRRTQCLGLIAAFVTLAVLIPAALAEEVGLLGLYQVRGAASDETLAQIRGGLRERGCRFQREGQVQGSQGKLKMKPANRFFFLACARSLLKDSAARSVFRPLEAASGGVTLLEGELEVFEDLARSGRGREYVIKLSYYSNLDPDRRERDLAAIAEMASARPDAYRNEALIFPRRAVGLPTPDEVTILSYDSPAQGQSFRDANGDLLKAIGRFNGDHLLSFAYLSASSTR